MKKINTILLTSFIFLISCSTPKDHKQESTLIHSDSTKTSAVPKIKPQDTVELKNNYRLIYFNEGDYRHLRLLGPTVDTVLWTNSAGLPEHNMGHLQADFDQYFVLYASYANGYNDMMVIEKKTGHDLAYGAGVKNDTLQNIVYYEDKDNPDHLTLLDLKTLKKESYPAPTGTTCTYWINCITTIKLSNKELTLEYITGKDQRQSKTYKR